MNNQASAERKPMWLRFVLAFICLVLAFASALFSTVAREQGHFWSTVVLASFALILATLVGVTTVPVLARRVMGQRVRDVFQFEVTRVGMLYVASIVLIGIAALNTGNNLLYIIVAAMLGAILISGFASAIMLRTVQLEVRLFDRVFAAQPAKATVILKSVRKRMPAFSITVKPIGPPASSPSWQWVRSTFTFPPGRSKDEIWLRLPDRQLKRIPKSAAAPVINSREIYFPFLGSGEASAEVEVTFANRGHYQTGVFAISTRFPFAFLAKTRHVRHPQSVVVSPQLQSAAIERIVPQIRGALETFLRGQGSELYGLREYQAQDSVRHLDWKATAKSGSLIVREFTREDEARVRIVFDNPVSGLLSQAQYEHGVSLAASLAWRLFLNGSRVSYVAAGIDFKENLDDFLSYLAAIQPAAQESSLDSMQADGILDVVITANPAGYVAHPIHERCLVVPFGTDNIVQ
jgi:uncharacterized protein (DUF58 family)